MISLLVTNVNLNNTHIMRYFSVFFGKHALSRFYFCKISMYTLHRALQISVCCRSNIDMKQSPREKLARTALSLAVIAVFSIFVFPVAAPYIFGSLSIVMAVLSKGGKSTMPRNSRTAFKVSALALLLNTALLIFTVYYFIQLLHDPELQKQYSETLYQMYGITFQDLLDQLGLSSGTLIH